MTQLPPKFAAAVDGEMVTLTGTLVGVTLQEKTRAGFDWATAVLACESGSVVVQFPPHPYDKYRRLVVKGARVTVTGRVDLRPDVPLLDAREVVALDVTTGGTG